MSDYVKRKIIYVSVFLPWVWFSLILISIFTVPGFEDAAAHIILWALFVGSVALMLVLIKKIGYPLKAVRAEKLSLAVNDYEEFLTCFETIAAKQGYKDRRRYIPANRYHMRMFSRMRRFLISMDSVLVAYLEEITMNDLVEIHELFWKYVKNNHEDFTGRRYRATQQTTLTMVICVDKMTPESYSYANVNAAALQTTIKFNWMFVVASFSDKIVYMARHKDGPGAPEHSDLRRYLLKLFKGMTEPVKAKQMALQLDAFAEFENCITVSAKKYGYTEYGFSIDVQFPLRVFTKDNGDSLHCLLVAYVKELTGEKFDDVTNLLLRFREYYEAAHGEAIKYMAHIPIICVDRMTPELFAYINSGVSQLQTASLVQLPVGIHFGDKTIYIARQKNGTNINAYKRILKEFRKVMGGIAKPV